MIHTLTMAYMRNKSKHVVIVPMPRKHTEMKVNENYIRSYTLPLLCTKLQIGGELFWTVLK